MNIRVIALVFTLTVAGCSELNYAIENYSDIDPVRFQFNDKAWRIFDSPSEERLMITPSLGDSARAGAIEGITLGLSGNVSGPEGAFHTAAAAYLESRPGSCRISNGAIILDPQWEFFYTC